MQRYENHLEKLKHQNLYRSLRNVIPQKKSLFIEHAGQTYLNFSSNDYLGLSHHPKMIAASQQAIQEFGTGSGASRLITGSLSLHHELEEKMAHFKAAKNCLLFNSGFQLNTTVIPALMQDQDFILSDALNHASLIDGCRLSKATTQIFRHNNMNDLESLLQKISQERQPDCNIWIVTESIFSMDGDQCYFREIYDLAKKYQAKIYFDEAHATGVIGKTGRGILEDCQIDFDEDCMVQMGTFSKALGSFGAYVCASKTIIEYLINTARGFIYTTALPPAVVAANLTALEILQTEPKLLQKLQENILFLKQCFQEHNITHSHFGESAIFPIILNDEKRALKIAQDFLQKGIWTQAIRPPTVPQGTSRIRFTVSALHEKMQIQNVVNDFISF